MALEVRRIVTGHDANGKAIVKTDERLQAVSRLGRPYIAGCEIWSTEKMPVDNTSDEAEAAQRAGPFRPTASRFHRSVADCTGNLPLIVLMNALADLTAGAAAALDVATRTKHRQMNTQFHRQLFEAIRAHDGDAAHAIMAKHVGDIQDRVRRSLAKRQPLRPPS